MGRHTALTDAEFWMKIKQESVLRQAEKSFKEVGFQAFSLMAKGAADHVSKEVVRERERRLREAKK